jgi:tRNA (guanine-N7-)-methyltransferase
MRPKMLKFPFRYEERQPLLLDDVLYVPKRYEQHALWDKTELKTRLSSFAEVCLEYCSGNGTWIAEKAKENPGSLWIAVEKRFDRVQKIWAKKHNFSLSNLLIICGEAYTFTHYYLEEMSVDRLFINFPDPWPKQKHAKHRLIQKPFTDEMARIAKPSATVTFATDDEDYSLQMIHEMQKDPTWKSCFPDPFYITNWDSYGSSYFEDLWKSQGRTIRYIMFTK